MTDADVMDLAIRLSVAFYERRADLLNGFKSDDVVDFLIFLVGAAIWFLCCCRMGKLTPAHRLVPRLSYALLMTGSVCLALDPLMFKDIWERLGALIFAATVFIHLLVIGIEWKCGRPPREMETQPGELPE